MDASGDLALTLGQSHATWLVTGAAGFIGSHLVEALLAHGQTVRGLDDFSTGSHRNLEDVRQRVGGDAWGRFQLIEADIRDREACASACREVDLVLHQAALGSVPRSIADPVTTHAVNTGGFLEVALAAQAAGCRRLVYASSSSVYGDSPHLPRREDQLGRPLSPYAASKRAAELFAQSLARTHGLRAVGLRYFNVFGPRQSPDGPYAAVIPRWIAALAKGEAATVFGDGATSRDFCPVGDVVQANLRAALVDPLPEQAVFNVGAGDRTTLLELLDRIAAELVRSGHVATVPASRHEAERDGDVRHSLADLTRVRAELGYEPRVGLERGLADTVAAFIESRSGRQA